MGAYDHVLGPLVLSVFFNIYAFGLVSLQYAAYCTTQYNDRKSLKSVVLGLFIVDLCQAILSIYMIWIFCVQNYAVPSALSSAVAWTYTIIPFFTAISSLLAHLFLAFRIYDLTKKRATSHFVELLTWLSFGVGVALGIFGMAKKISMIDIINNASPAYWILTIVWLGLQVSVDYPVAACLTYSANQSGEGFMDLLPNINLAFREFIGSNSFSSLLSILALVVYVAVPKSNAYMIFLLPLGRAHAATVLISLLRREKLPETSEGIETSTKAQWTNPSYPRNPQTRKHSISLEQEIVLEVPRHKSDYDRSSASGSSTKDFHYPYPSPTLHEEEIDISKMPEGSYYKKSPRIGSIMEHVEHGRF